jgi:hypothetical protein
LIAGPPSAKRRRVDAVFIFVATVAPPARPRASDESTGRHPRCKEVGKAIAFELATAAGFQTPMG